MLLIEIVTVLSYSIHSVDRLMILFMKINVHVEAYHNIVVICTCGVCLCENLYLIIYLLPIFSFKFHYVPYFAHFDHKLFIQHSLFIFCIISIVSSYFLYIEICLFDTLNWFAKLDTHDFTTFINNLFPSLVISEQTLLIQNISFECTKCVEWFLLFQITWLNYKWMVILLILFTC